MNVHASILTSRKIQANAALHHSVSACVCVCTGVWVCCVECFWHSHWFSAAQFMGFLFFCFFYTSSRHFCFIASLQIWIRQTKQRFQLQINEWSLIYDLRSSWTASDPDWLSGLGPELQQQQQQQQQPWSRPPAGQMVNCHCYNANDAVLQPPNRRIQVQFVCFVLF